MPKYANGMKLADKRMVESRLRKKKFIELMTEGKTIDEACQIIGMTRRSYDFWRYKDKSWAAGCDSARVEYQRSLGITTATRNHATGFNFAMDRMEWFGHESPWFQLEVVQAIEKLGPGDILMVLLPPAHGKTTLYEDFVTLRLAYHPNLRHHVGSESQSLSKKVLKRIRDRLDPIPGWVKMEQFGLKYGPFAPPKDERRRNNQPWTSTHFDIWRKGNFDERDYSMAALGFGSQIIGSRSDHLHLDDVQSMKTLNQTENYVNEFTQDWLSRPGEGEGAGFTTIMGNRIDEGDFYEAVMEQIPGDILKVIRYPAIRNNPETNEPEPLWGDLHTLETLDRMRKKIGDVRFERNWMQRPRAVRMKTFDEEMIDRCKEPLLRLETVKERSSHVIGLDPGFGINAVVACRFDDDGMWVTHIREDRGLYNNHQVLSIVEDVAADITNKGGIVSDFIIEDKAFQRGLLRDPQTERIQRRYGCAVRGHQTGSDRNDENIGVPSIVHTMLRGELHLPWADDEYTRFWVNELRMQMLSWKPSSRGNKLRMDILMALWFCWIQWRNRRGTYVVDPSDFRTPNRMPYPKSRGLILPRGYSPTLTRR